MMMADSATETSALYIELIFSPGKGAKRKKSNFSDDNHGRVDFWSR